MKEATTNASIKIDIDKKKFLEDMRDFFVKSAMGWQSYISYEFIKGIKLSESQNIVLNSESNQSIINGSAGSGKSIVLLYKLIKYMMEEKEPKRFLYVTYNQILIDDTLKRARMYYKFNDLIDKHEAVHICTFHQFATNMLKEIGFDSIGNIKIDYSHIHKMRSNSYIKVVSILYKYELGGIYYDSIPKNEKLYKTHDAEFVRDEILWMKANGYIELEEYLKCDRVGRGNTPRLEKNQRKTIFKIFNEYINTVRSGKWTKTLTDLEDYALILLGKIKEISESQKYDYIFVDEIQDLDAMQLKLLANLYKKSLVLTGDPKQKIYKKSPHRYTDLGINITNNCKNLYENFRSTQEIMKLANSLNFTDIVRDNSRIKYINNGEKPKIFYSNNWDKAIKHIGTKIQSIQEKYPKSSIAIITREEELKANGNTSVLKKALGRYFKIISIEDYDKKFKFENEKQVIYTDLYNVKGLEFDYVFLLQFDAVHYPNKKEMDNLKRYSDKEKVENKDIIELINTEKRRLYVAMSRAKKYLEMICVSITQRGISDFIKDFNKNDYNYETEVVKK